MLDCQEIKASSYEYFIYFSTYQHYLYNQKSLKDKLNNLNDAEIQEMKDIENELLGYIDSMDSLDLDKDYCDEEEETYLVYFSYFIKDALKGLYLIKEHLIENADIYEITEFKNVFESYRTYIRTRLNQYKEKQKEWSSDYVICEDVSLQYFYTISREINMFSEPITIGIPFSSISFFSWKKEFAEIDPDFPDLVEDFNLFIFLDDVLLPFVEKNLSKYGLRLLSKNADRKKYNHIKILKSMRNLDLDFEDFEKYEDMNSLDGGVIRP